MKTSRPILSEYIHWAKTRSAARLNLATSGIQSLAFAELGAELEDLALTSTSAYGYPPLVEALAAKCGVPAACVVTAAGTSFANHLALAALLEPGDEVVLETPVYEPITALVRYLGATVRSFERRADEGFRVDPEAVARQVTAKTRAIVLTNLHNPSGAETDEATLRALGGLARSAGARVLVDEVYLEMLWMEGARTAPVPSAFHLGPEFVVTSSLTKAYGLSGLRCGWVLAAPELAERMWRLDDLFASSGVHVAERLSAVALRQLDRIADRAQDLLTRDRTHLDAFLATRDDLELARPAHGTVIFPRWRGGDVAPVAELLRTKYETTIVPGAFFGMNDHFRLGLGGGCPDVAEALGRLGSALDELG